MRVLFDEQIFLLQKRGGISRYFVELIRAFAASPELGIEPILAFKTTSNDFLKELATELDLGISSHKTSTQQRIARSVFSSGFESPKVDLIHHTFYSRFFWTPRFKGPRVSTHYDMIPEIFGETSFGVNSHLSKLWYYKNVDRILSISNSSKTDLNNIWPEVKTPISITHLGSPSKTLNTKSRVRGYVIYVGARQGYKDALTLMRAFAATPESLRTRLDFVGGGRFTETELQVIDKLGISSQVTQKDLTDAELETAYGSAHVFVCTSKSEGFGLPALEALNYGCRTILSDAPALIEVAGDCADYFKAGDVAILTSAMTTALSEKSDLNPYLELGLQRARQFSWKETAKLTAKAYQTLS